ncbi:MAG TPA: hypothetical protein VK400_12380 [Pyrinomonadaceae bacterium]|nr:hypothetical protein [Pyrinomonadaceae bacterium]
MAESTERIVELTADELVQLNKKLISDERASSGGGLYLAAIVIVVCFLVCVFCFYIIYVQLSYGGIDLFLRDVTEWVLLAVGIVSLIVLIIFARMLKSYLQQKQEVALLDPKTVRKQIIIAPVEEQKLNIDENITKRGKVNQTQNMEYRFTVTIAGQKYRVTEDDYYKLNPGQLAEVHHLISLEKPDVKVFAGVFPAAENKESDA